MSNLEGRWRRVYSNEWHEPAFQGLTNDERVVYFYARTGSQSTSVGIYRLSTAVAVEDLGNLTAVEFDYRLDVVCRAFDWRFDGASRVLWMPDWIHHNPPQSPNVCKSWRKLLTNLPDCELKIQAIKSIEDALRTLPEPFRRDFGSLSKELRISKAQARPQTRANQGAGEQGNQGSGSRGTGRGIEKNGNGHNGHVPTEHVKLARETLKLVSDSRPIDELIDCFYEVGRGRIADPSRSEVLAALNVVLNEGRTA